MKSRTLFWLEPTARSTRPRHKVATVSSAPDVSQSLPFRGKCKNRFRSACMLQDRVMSAKAVSSNENLLDELQTTLAHGTVARRVETLRRVTDRLSTAWLNFLTNRLGCSMTCSSV